MLIYHFAIIPVILKEIHIDIGGGNGGFYLSRAHPLADFFAGRQWIVLDPLITQGHDEGGVHFQPGGIYPGEILPFPDNSIAGLDANFILREDQPRLTALLTEADRVLRPEAELVICDYQHVINDLVVWAGQIPAITDFYMSDPRQAELGERSFEADMWLIWTGAVTIPKATDFINEFQRVDLSGVLTNAMFRNDLTPEAIRENQSSVPHILSFQKK